MSSSVPTSASSGFHHAQCQGLVEPKSESTAGRTANNLAIFQQGVVAECIGIVHTTDLQRHQQIVDALLPATQATHRDQENHPCPA